MKPHFIRLIYFVWIVVPIAVYWAYGAYGLPHMIWSYSFQGSYTDWTSRRYTRCTFVGPYGVFTTYPVDGTCAWVVLLKEQGAAQ